MIQKNEIFYGTVIQLYLAVSHQMVWLAAGMSDPFVCKIVTQNF